MDENRGILIAEDESLVAEMIQGMLEEQGHRVVGVAVDGNQAVSMATTLRPDAVLMDIHMPGCDGLEAARRIAETCPAPVVVLTAFETPEMVDRASEAGVGAYLTKPPNARELERALTIAKARFHDLMELRRINHQLTEALAAVRQLSGLLPICSNCKRIRDSQGAWQELEAYIHRCSGAEFTHGICPDCSRDLYPDYTRAGPQ
ncbi:MAG: response regulator [Deferrisomatales bacterium]|nr:response regulator [Deferrisomatales bacterium]